MIARRVGRPGVAAPAVRVALTGVVLVALMLAAGAGAVEVAPAGMVLVPAGPFTLGCDQGQPDEGPAHRAELPAFFLDRTEVTNADYARFVRSTGHAAPPDWPGSQPDPGRLSYPVVNVSWYDASAYARWAGKRLPTEMEWEKAARGADGRLLPWGGEWSDALANVEGKGPEALRAVGSIPAGASPCGALDITGNAWEWTADWYTAYPGNSTPSIHYGDRYRVARGEGAIGFYNSPPLGTHRATVRVRVQPHGRYDGLGFRCARDFAPGAPGPPDSPPGRVDKPVPASESPAAVAARYSGGVPIEVREGQGITRGGIATFGVPLPEGAVRDAGSLRTNTPLQARPLARWRDGSLRWALVDVPARVPGHGRQVLRLRWDGQGAVSHPLRPVTVAETPDEVTIRTGASVVRVKRGDTRWLELDQGDRRLEGPDQYVTVAEGTLVNDRAVTTSKNRLLMMRPPVLVRVEDRGPLRVRVRLEGWLVDTEESPILRYRARVDVRAGSPHVGLVYSFTHLSPRRILMIEDYRLRFRYTGGAATAFGAGGSVLPAQIGARLEQLSSVRYSLRSGEETATGARAEGWVAFGGRNEALIAVRDFWQNFPKALIREEDGVTVCLWTGPEPFDADQGLSKTHELLLSIDAAGGARDQALAQLREPLFGVAPADWYCATRGLGALAPYDLARYPVFETEVEAAADLMARNRPYGMRHYGDNYLGRPHKGVNAYQDLEYDVPYNHFLQFARTGARKYLAAALVQARHHGDIDVQHDGGPQWKHSTRHTTTEADLFGRVFPCGLVASTWVTGDPEGLENARVIGEWLARVADDLRSQGNERQIGWALYLLSGIYEATWDRRYLAAMQSIVDRLLAGQDALGRFDIRYDNRIAFFYGVILSGFVRYHEVTGDARIPEAVRRMATRLHGFYPDYGGRTLEGLAWLYMRTGDPEVGLTAQRTWESTLDWRAFDLGGMTIFTTRFLPSVAMLGLSPPPEWRIPETGPVEDGLRRNHYRASSGVVFLLPREAGRPVSLVLLRHAGAGPARVRLSSGTGREVEVRSLPATGDALQYVHLQLPGAGPFRLELTSEVTRAWDLLTDRPVARVFHVPGGEHLEALTPRVHLAVVPGASEVIVSLRARGEGLKGALLYDPAGHPRGAVEEFVDLGDARSYKYTLRVPLPPGSAGKLWSLDLQNVTVGRLEGLRPYATTQPASYFAPPAP